MKNWVKWTFVVLLVVGVILLVRGCQSIARSACGTRVLQRVPSPSKKLEAVVYDYDCGATTRFSTQVDLFKPDEMPTERGEVFDATQTAYVQVLWTSDTTLSLTYEGDKGFEFEGGKKRHGVTVTLKQQ